ncbi:MAG: hypothetical protein ACR2FE_00485 [Aeromicrobium sp.]
MLGVDPLDDDPATRHAEGVSELRRRPAVVYEITYPNGKIYVGLDLTSTTTYMGSPSQREAIVADFTAEQVRDFTVRKRILWESTTASDAEARAMEVQLIKETGANDPRVGYNLRPKFRPSAGGTER